jgi:Skp family chaperone for outer membrane proteins
MMNVRNLALLLAIMCANNATAQQSAPTVAPINTTVTVLGSAAPISLGESARTVLTADKLKMEKIAI